MRLTRREALAGAAAAAAGLASPALGQQVTAPAPRPQQAPGYYRYRIGAIEVTAINDGYAERPIEGYVKNAPVAEVQQLTQQLRQPAGKVRVPYNSLVLRTGGKTVLIDTGNGDSGPPTAGAWMDNFKAAGFDPATVDVVILSHFHGDHINGLRLKSGQWMFPRAEVKVPAAEWNWWMDDNRMASVPDGMRGAFQNVRRVFGPVAGSVAKFAADAEVVPGVTALAAYGHTPGHTVFAVVSGSEKLMLMSDVTNHTGVFLRQPEWHVLFDINPEEAAKTRRRMADLAVSEGMQVAFYHAPFPATGYIERAGNGYRLEPVQWS
jgi:glyoxylase-like metal-dependent hydrolase (beta-lactamase superfamily II)